MTMKEYRKLEMEVITFTREDVITTSGDPKPDTETPAVREDSIVKISVISKSACLRGSAGR